MGSKCWDWLGVAEARPNRRIMPDARISAMSCCVRISSLSRIARIMNRGSNGGRRNFFNVDGHVQANYYQ
jgi:hypothetical protein